MQLRNSNHLSVLLLYSFLFYARCRKFWRIKLYKQVDAQRSGRYDTRSSRQLKQMSQNRSISAGEMHPTICVEQAGDHFGLSLTLIDPVLTKICTKTIFIFFVPNDLDLQITDMFLQSYYCPALCFPPNWSFYGFPIFEKIRGTGRTDRRTGTGCNATLNAALREGRTIMCSVSINIVQLSEYHCEIFNDMISTRVLVKT